MGAISHSITPDINMELNPYVGRMASRLVRSFTSEGSDADRWALITEILGFAAEAEQLLTEQRERIAELESLATTDPLTGVANRRGFESFLQRALANADRHGETGIVAVMDLDGFKKINDRHGHLVGDECLRLVARHLSDSLRVTDLVARPGGDEFMAVLTHCRAEDGFNRMENLRRELDRLTLHHESAEIPLRVSLGMAAYGPGINRSALLAAADAAMYRDKRRRRARR